MGHMHPSTPAERAQWAAYLLAHDGEHGVITHISRVSGASRPTVYAWRERARAALVAVWAPPAPPAAVAPDLIRHVLTIWCAHASTRAIQQVLATTTGQHLSLATITAILHDAQQRAIAWMQTPAPPGRRALALDEIYAHDRRGAYLNVVDVHSGAVWASEGPLPVDTESWQLVLWSLQDRAVRWDRVVGDEGPALQAACQAVCPAVPFQSDQWHVWQTCAQSQARLNRVGQRLAARTPAVTRQAARVAAGQRPRGRCPQSDVAAHAAAVATAQRVATAVSILTHEVRRLVHVVVCDHRGVLTAAQRQADLTAALALLAEVRATAPADQQAEVQRVWTRLTNARSGMLAFVPQVDQVQQDLAGVLAPDQQALLAWAWLRRTRLGWTSADILAAIPPTWREAARVLLATWDTAVRVSSAVERWHSILRPHLTVRRRLTTGMLALLAVWHNHRVFPRGQHKGKNPLHLSGIPDAPTDWLVALGYPPAPATTGQEPAPCAVPLAA